MKKQIKNGVTLLLCGLFFMVIYLGMREKETPILDTKTIQVIFKDEVNTLIPVNMEVDASLSFEEISHDVFLQMQSNAYRDLGLYPLLPSDVEVNGILLEDHQLSIDFTSSLETIDPKDELRIVEGLVYVYDQFEDVDRVSLWMNGMPLDHMPHGLPLNESYDQSLGLNNFDTVSSYLHKTTPLTIYASKNIQGKDYYVPITRRVDLDTMTLNQQVLFVLKEISVSTYLGNNKELAALELEKQSTLDNGILTIHLSEDVLLEDTFMDQKLLSMISLSLKEIKGVEEVHIKVDDIDLSESMELLDVVEVISNTVKL